MALQIIFVLCTPICVFIIIIDEHISAVLSSECRRQSIYAQNMRIWIPIQTHAEFRQFMNLWSQSCAMTLRSPAAIHFNVTKRPNLITY